MQNVKVVLPMERNESSICDYAISNTINKCHEKERGAFRFEMKLSGIIYKISSEVERVQ